MRLFLHTQTRIRIINGDLEWAGTPAEFALLEPTYAGLPIGATVRYQTPDLSYYEDSSGRHSEPPTCLNFCDLVAAYLVSDCIWVHADLDTPILNVNTPAAVINVSAHLKPTSDPESDDLPISSVWIIRPWHETGARDALMLGFVAGVCDFAYTYRDGLMLGDWFVREEDFDIVSFGGVPYRVKLAAPVKYTLYRV